MSFGIIKQKSSPQIYLSGAFCDLEGILKVIIAGAGGAAHLPGMVASLTPLPVIGVPVTPKNAHLDGLDALMSIVQVVPVMQLMTRNRDFRPVSTHNGAMAVSKSSKGSHCDAHGVLFHLKKANSCM